MKVSRFDVLGGALILMVGYCALRPRAPPLPSPPDTSLHVNTPHLTAADLKAIAETKAGAALEAKTEVSRRHLPRATRLFIYNNARRVISDGRRKHIILAETKFHDILVTDLAWQVLSATDKKRFMFLLACIKSKGEIPTNEQVFVFDKDGDELARGVPGRGEYQGVD